MLAFGRFNRFKSEALSAGIIASSLRTHYEQAISNDIYRLDVAILGETDPHVKNTDIVYQRGYVLHNLYALYPLPQTLLPATHFAKALIVLSDSWRLGDINACFAPTTGGETGHTFYLSNDKLSEQVWRLRYKPILERFGVAYHYTARYTAMGDGDQKVAAFSSIGHYLYAKNHWGAQQMDTVHALDNYVTASYPGVVTWHQHRHLYRPWTHVQPIISIKKG